MLSRFHPIPERNGQMDGQTDLLYQYRVSVCWCMIKTESRTMFKLGGEVTHVTVKKSKVNVWHMCIVHRREVPLMRYRFPYVGADLCKLAHQPGIQRTLCDHEYGLAYHTICLFTVFPQFLPVTHSSLTTDAKLRLSRPGCMVLHRGSLPVQRQSPT